ncbi:MAG TPA: protein phosphatase 2C domain-containing protein, partial [Acidisarcina sp.]
MLDVEFSQLTDTGRVRGGNEDYIDCVTPVDEEEVRSHGWLFTLADGAGGHNQGEVASRTAVECILAGFRSAPKAEPHTALLPQLIQAANEDVYETGRLAGEGGSGMATTIVACALRYASAVVSHVGDSRCYLIRRGVATQLTRDHTLVAEQVRMGLLKPEEAATSANRHVLSRSLGSGMFISVDTRLVQLQPGDMMLLCSDGLHGALSMENMARIATTSPSLDEATRKMIA